jgi:hypothetical protein
MFGLDIPIPIRGLPTVHRLARLLMPIVGRMPLSMLYPTGEKQETVVPKYHAQYQGNTITAGDFLYVKQHMPEAMQGKVIVTNTTTEADVAFLKARGIRYLITTTPLLDGRTFGTNMMEAALIAASGKARRLTDAELNEMIERLGFQPTLQKLNA